MVIEDNKAHEKWCPEAQVPGHPAYIGHSFNRDRCGGMKHMPTCLGSRCAAWRWWDEGGPCETPLAKVELATQRGWILAEDQRLAREGISVVMVSASPTRKGYCGKAERPTCI